MFSRMPRNCGRKNGSVRKQINKEKQNKNSDPALQNFSCFNGVVIDFQKLFNYQPPVLPIYDVRLIDRFNPSVVKYEYVMIKIGEEFHSMDYDVRKFTGVSVKLMKIFAEMKHLWDISPDFVQKNISQAYGQLPEITLETSLALNNQCMLDFMTLTVAIKYAVILKKYKNHLREQILQKREPILRDYIRQNKFDPNCKGLQFYEWFLCLMFKYADNNNKLFAKNIVSSDCDLSIPYILPFVGLGSPAEFYSAHAICRSPDYSQYDLKEDSAGNTDEKKEIDEEVDIVITREDDDEKEDSSEMEETVQANASETDFRNNVAVNPISNSEEIAEEQNSEAVNPELAERFLREAVIMNDAFIRFIQNNFNHLTPGQIELANAVRSATTISIREMSSYLENEDLNYTADDLGEEEWTLLCHYVQLCHKVFIGEGNCDEIVKATNKRELNEIRLSYLARYETKRLEEIKHSIELKEKRLKDQKEAKAVENRIRRDLCERKSMEEEHVRNAPTNDRNTAAQVCNAPSHVAKLSDKDMNPEEIRMMKLYMKTSRPGNSTDAPTWDYEDSDDDF